MAKAGLCGKSWRAAFPALHRKRVSDSLQTRLPRSVKRSTRFTSKALRVGFISVDLRRRGKKRAEVREIPGLYPRHSFIRFGEVDQYRQWRGQSAARFE